MTNDHNQVLLDSDAFIGWMIEDDAHHQAVVAQLEKIKKHHTEVITTNLVIAETATMLSRRKSQEDARIFLRASQNIATIFIDRDLHQQTFELFVEQANKNTSFVDMANVVVMRQFNFSQIFSFDQVYRKKFQLPTAV